MLGFGCGVLVLGFSVWGWGFQVWGVGPRICVLGFGVQDLRFWLHVPVFQNGLNLRSTSGDVKGGSGSLFQMISFRPSASECRECL